MNERLNLICPVCGGSATKPKRERNGFPVAECPNCKSGFALVRNDELPSYDDLYQVGNIYDGYHSAAKRANLEATLYWYQPKILKLVGPGQGKTHLDIGSGLGTFPAIAKTRGWRSYGIDISPDAAKSAKESLGVETFVGTLKDVPLEAGSVHWVSAFEVLEHLLDPQEEVAKISQLLSKGGYFTISVPNGRSRNERTTKNPLSLPPHHVNYFSKKGLVDMMEKAGFSTTYCYEKPFAWGELSWPKVVRLALLPALIADGYLLGHRGNRLVWVGQL